MTRRRPARRVIVLTAASAAAGALAAGDLRPALAQTDPAALSVRVAVQEMPAYLTPGEPFTLRARLVSDGSDSLDRVQVRLRVGEAVGSRSELAQLARTPPVDGAIVPFDDGTIPEEIAPGDVTSLDVELPGDALARVLGTTNGVHPVRIEVRARSGSGRRVTVGVADTFLPWWPEATATTRIAWVWPLTAAHTRGGDGRFLDDSLADELDDEGRLDTLLSVAAAAVDRTPVTWAVDPALVDAAAQMTGGYAVRGATDKRATDGVGAEAADRWLREARAALSDPRSRTLALPYGDPDVAALTRAGLRDLTGAAIDTGRRVLTEHRFPAGERDLAWPPEGAVDVPTLGVLAVHGARSVVLSGPNLQLADDDESNATPSAASTLAGAATATLTALAADHQLAQLVADGPSAGGTAEGTRLALQRVVAETAFFTLERPSQSRDLVVAPPRGWNPTGPFAAGLLDVSSRVPWLRPDVLTNVASRPRDDVERLLSYTSADRERELPGAVLTSARAERDRVEQYRALLVPSREEPPDRLADRLELALLRATSAGFRAAPQAARELVDDVRDLLSDRFGKVTVAHGGLITMGGDTARLPITLVNDLDHTVRVQLRIETRNRLALPDGPVRDEVVAPGRRQLQVRAQALVPGDFVISVSLATTDGRRLPGEPTTLRVRSSAYGKVALAITIGAFVLLLIGSVTRLLRRRRSAEE